MVKRQRTTIIHVAQNLQYLVDTDHAIPGVARTFARNALDELHCSFPELFPLRASAPLRENSVSAQTADQNQIPEGSIPQ